ncbi:MAG TPA: OmpH family outer membrane protein [Candidatus Butyricimonas faecavium]|nr:OmpH family outer membrane protein [Candidatus Butyricimonas faecavium]
MKNLSIGLNVVLLIAVIVLYVLHFSGNGKDTSNQSGTATVNADTKIVYINMDTLLNNYTQSRELNEAFLKKLEANRTELNIKVKNFDREAAEFRNKVENNGFMTRERAEQAQMDLMIKQQNLQKLQQEMTENAQREQMEINRKLYDAITNFLTEYNKTKGFQLILSTTLGGNVLFAQEGFDITNDVVNQLNEQYKKK